MQGENMLKIYASCKSGEYNELKVSVGYTREGISLSSGERQRGGFYIYFTPVSRKDCGGGAITESSTMFSGFKLFALASSRDSKKNAQTIFDKLRSDGIMEALARAFEVGGETGKECLLILNKAGIIPAENYPNILMPKQADSEVIS
jgi:hypothetical protein